MRWQPASTSRGSHQGSDASDATRTEPVEADVEPEAARISIPLATRMCDEDDGHRYSCRNRSSRELGQCQAPWRGSPTDTIGGRARHFWSIGEWHLCVHEPRWRCAITVGRQLVGAEDAARWFNGATDHINKQDSLGHRIQLAKRGIAWCTAPGCDCELQVCGEAIKPTEFEHWLLQATETMAELCALRIIPDCCTIELYADGKQRSGWHADWDTLFGAKHGNDIMVIALFLGATRNLEVKGQWEGARRALPIKLHHGDVVVMEGQVQAHYLRRIAAENTKSPTVCLTWRWIRRHTGPCRRPGCSSQGGLDELNENPGELTIDGGMPCLPTGEELRGVHADMASDLCEALRRIGELVPETRDRSEENPTETRASIMSGLNPMEEPGGARPTILTMSRGGRLRLGDTPVDTRGSWERERFSCMAGSDGRLWRRKDALLAYTAEFDFPLDDERVRGEDRGVNTGDWRPPCFRLTGPSCPPPPWHAIKMTGLMEATVLWLEPPCSPLERWRVNRWPLWTSARRIWLINEIAKREKAEWLSVTSLGTAADMINRPLDLLLHLLLHPPQDGPRFHYQPLLIKNGDHGSMEVERGRIIETADRMLGLLQEKGVTTLAHALDMVSTWGLPSAERDDDLRVMPDMPMTRRVKEGSAPSTELEQREADKRRRRFAEFGLALEKADNA